MRKLFLLLIFFSAVQLYSQSADYPYIMNNGTIFINAGVGFGNAIGKGTKMSCPPLTVSMDIAIPVLGFPISLGIIAGYFSESGSISDTKLGIVTKIDSELEGLLVAGRIAYHVNFFKLARLDPYVLITIGGIIGNLNTKTTINNNTGAAKSNKSDLNDFWYGVSAGTRYFFTPNIGAFVELGLGNVQNFSFGVSFKL